MWAETPQSAANSLAHEDIKEAKYDATARSRQELAIVMKALEEAKEEQMKEE